jgi:putative DNA primase/helicase
MDKSTSSDPSAQAIPPRPQALPVIPEQIPEPLKALKQFVIWRYFWIADKHIWDKPPLNGRTGNAASSTNPATWTTFDQTTKSYASGLFDGIGFVLCKKNQRVGCDLDHCRDPATGEIDAWAWDIIQALNTYTEISPSGTGFHLLAEGTLPGKGRKKGAIEFYDTARYLTLTGQHLNGTPTTIEPRQDAINALLIRVFGPSQTESNPQNPQPNGNSSSIEDDEILVKACAARNGEKFQRLWKGDTTDYASNGNAGQSEADLGLCALIAFWTRVPEQIDRLFRRSDLMRPKWDETRGDETYGAMTIRKALAFQRDTWHGREPEVDEIEHTSISGDTEQEKTEADAGAGDGHQRAESGDNESQGMAEERPLVHLTDRGNALRLIKAHGKDLHYIYRWKKWLVWDGSRWIVDEGNRVEALAKWVITQLYLEAKAIIDELSELHDEPADMGEAVRKIRAHKLEVATATLKWALKSESAERLSGMLRQARSERGIAITPDELDADSWLLNCANGTIDLRTGTLRPHRREDLCSKRINISYDPDATCPNWSAFLWRIMSGPKPDEEGHETVLLERHEAANRMVAFLKRAVGYSLTGVIREQVLFFMYGGGDNGKSTFSETIAALLGEYYQKAPKELLMHKDRGAVGGPSPEIARLYRVRLVIASEVGEYHRLNEAQVKDLTGDDTLTARGLYEAFFQFRPTHKLWMYGNHKPGVQGTDDAIWKRPKLIPFTEKIPPSEQVSDLREARLIPELPGILAWAVQGCLDWQKDGLKVPDEVNAATVAYRREMDAIAAFFEEHCLIGKSYTAKGVDLYARYTQWAESGREIVLPRRKFYSQLREHDCESFTVHSNVLCWRGIGLKPTESSKSDGEDKR